MNPLIELLVMTAGFHYSLGAIFSVNLAMFKASDESKGPQISGHRASADCERYSGAAGLTQAPRGGPCCLPILMLSGSHLFLVLIVVYLVERKMTSLSAADV